MKRARFGIGYSNKWLAFLTAALGAVGTEGKQRWLLKRINRLSKDGFVDLHFKINGKPIIFSTRQNDMDDYRIAGELVRGGYVPPDFAPSRIIDGGANIGMFALFAHAHFPGVPIVCYEPEPNNFAQLLRNLRLNNLRVEAHQQGLWSGSTTLFFQKRNSYAGFVSGEPSDLAVECIRPAIGDNCWLKLDIEGGEYEVIPALMQANDKPRWLSMELHNPGGKAPLLVQCLKDNGYTVIGGEVAMGQCCVLRAWLTTR